MRVFSVFIFLIYTCYYSKAQDVYQTLAKESIMEFRDFLALANDAHIPADIEKNIVYTQAAFTKRDFPSQRLKTNGLDLVLAHKIYDIKFPTILVYLQADGQPVDPTKWQQETPWISVLKENISGTWKTIEWNRLNNEWNDDWRIFARSTSDAKGPMLAFWAALDKMQKEGKTPNYNIKVIVDFEEELGSPNITEAIDRHKEILKADAMMIFDGPQHFSNRPTLAYGARGIVSLNLTAYGPLMHIHSGHYGNYVPNPVFNLSQLLASMKDKNGRVLIKGYYDGIKIDKKTKSLLAKTPDDLPAFRKSVGINNPEKVGNSLQEAIQYPSLNINGIRSAYVGAQSRTIIPDLATASIDMRLVKETKGAHMVSLLKNHIVAQGYTLLDHEPSLEERSQFDKIISMQYQIAYEAFRTEYAIPFSHFLINSIKEGMNVDPIIIRTHGGSIPISPFVAKLGIPAIAVPTVNYDNNQHSENENIRLGHYKDAIKTYYSILTTKYEQ